MFGPRLKKDPFGKPDTVTLLEEKIQGHDFLESHRKATKKAVEAGKYDPFMITKEGMAKIWFFGSVSLMALLVLALWFFGSGVNHEVAGYFEPEPEPYYVPAEEPGLYELVYPTPEPQPTTVFAEQPAVQEPAAPFPTTQYFTVWVRFAGQYGKAGSWSLVGEEGKNLYTMVLDDHPCGVPASFSEDVIALVETTDTQYGAEVTTDGNSVTVMCTGTVDFVKP